MCILSEKLNMKLPVTCIWGYRFFLIYLTMFIIIDIYLSLTTVFKYWYLRNCVYVMFYNPTE